MIQVNPTKYAGEILGASALQSTDPTDSQNNPFDPDLGYRFFEVDADGGPLPEPRLIARPENVPTAINPDVREPKALLSREVNNPFNPDLIYKFFAAEMEAAEAKLLVNLKSIETPESVPTAINPDMGESKALLLPEVTKTVANDRLPNITKTAISRESRPQDTAIDPNSSQDVNTLSRSSLSENMAPNDPQSGEIKRKHSQHVGGKWAPIVFSGKF
jgi:hypothetical protein